MNIAPSPTPIAPVIPSPRAPESAGPEEGQPVFAEALRAAGQRQADEADDASRGETTEPEDVQAVANGGLLPALPPDAHAVAATIVAGQGGAAGLGTVTAEGGVTPAVPFVGTAVAGAGLPAGEGEAAVAVAAASIPTPEPGAAANHSAPATTQGTAADLSAPSTKRSTAAEALTRRIEADRRAGGGSTQAGVQAPLENPMLDPADVAAAALLVGGPSAAATAVPDGGPAGLASLAGVAAKAEPREAAPLAVAREVGSPGWAQEVGDKLSQFVTLRADRAQIRLHPESLGPIQVRIAWHDDNATMLIIAPQPVTREALEQAMPQLRESLAAQGVTLGEVSVRDGGAGGDETRGGAQARGGRPDRPGTDAALVTPIPEAGSTGRPSRLVDTFA